MAIVQILCLFLLLESAYSDDALVRPCKVGEIGCVQEVSESFFEKTAAGIPEHDLKPIDPLHISMVCAQGGKNLMLHFKNITVTGLKYIKVADFGMDIQSKSVSVKMTANLNIESDLVIEFTDVSKTLTGKYSAKANTKQDIKYKYDVTTDDKGVEYFVVGDEEINCETLSVPEVTLDGDLQNQLSKDPDALKKSDEYNLHKTELRKEHVCKIAKEAYKTVVYNIRALAKFTPMSKFFTDMKGH